MPTPSVQTDLLARLEALGIVAHGVLQLLGQGASGALEVLGPIAKLPGNPQTWDTVKIVAYAGIAAAAAVVVRELAQTVRAAR